MILNIYSIINGQIQYASNTSSRKASRFSRLNTSHAETKNVHIMSIHFHFESIQVAKPLLKIEIKKKDVLGNDE